MTSSTQREILEALIQLYEKRREAVKGEDISALLHRNPGTIRNQMQTLKALGYVDGVPGPKGGYSPAMKAYEALDMEVIKEPYIVPVYRDGKRIEGVSVQKIVFTKVMHPTECVSLITVLGDSRQIQEHDVITVGPTPVNHVIVRGEVIGRDDSRREIRMSSQSITSIPKGKVLEVMSKRLIQISPDASIRECAKTLIEKRIRAAPVIDHGKLVGIITEGEIVRAVSQGQEDSLVGDVAVREPLTVESGARLIECIEKMKKHDVGRLIVTNRGRTVGMVTRTDILLRMLQ